MIAYRLLAVVILLVAISSTCLPAAALDMRGDTIYMIMADRFFDGDPTNNTAGNVNQYSPDHTEWGKYFGGDIAGITQKLDYLTTIGATALWITPLCQNDPYLISGGTPYHGYDMMDLYRVEPHFGNWAAFDALTDGMHSRGMKMILDVNMNNGGYTGSGNLCRMYKDGVIKADYNRDYKNWYHHNGGIPGDKWEDQWWVLNGDIFGMADLNQDQSVVRRYLLSGVAKWMWHGVDGFRLDAAKHIPLDYMRQFTDEMNKIAGWLGKPGTYAFAEYYGGGAYNQASIDWAHQANTALFDFSLASDLRDVELENISFNQLWNNVQNRQTAYGTDFEGGSNSNWQVIWFDSQDWQRLYTVLLQKYGGNEIAAQNRVTQGIVLLETLPGIPCIYYGTEQYLHNDTPGSGGVPGADPFNRPMMANWDTNTNAAKTLAALSNLRKNHPAVQYGDIQQRYITSSLFCYSRQWSGSAVVVALNNSGVWQEMTVGNLPLADGWYEDILHPGTYVQVTGGSGHFHLDATSSTVLVKWPASGSFVAQGVSGQGCPETQNAKVKVSGQGCPETTTPTGTLAASGLSASSTITFDGRNIPADFAGHLVAAQDNFTWFGDAGHPGNGSELDQLFVTNDASALQMGITGNLEANGNSWLIFLQTAPDGASTLNATAGPPSGVVSALKGTMMHENFAPSWLLVINTYGGIVNADLVDLVHNTTRYLGSVAVNSGSGVLAGGSNPNGARIAFDNTNTAGVTSDTTKSTSQTQADAATATSGTEILLPFADVQLSTDKPKVMVLLAGSGGYISNQSLPGYGGKFYNPGVPPIDFDRIPANQFAEVALTGISFSAQPSVAALKTLPSGSAVSLQNMVVTGTYYPFSCYYIEDSNRSCGIRVRDANSSPAVGKLVTVQGFISTEGGERIINAASTTIGNYGTTPKSLGLPNKTLGGPGVDGFWGLVNTGLLVTTWGTVTDRGVDENGNDFFYIDDGSGIWDGSYKSDGQKRLGARAIVNYVYPDIGSRYRVMGVSSIQIINGVPQRRILPRNAVDVWPE